jgi:putative membrane protein
MRTKTFFTLVVAASLALAITAAASDTGPDQKAISSTVPLLDLDDPTIVAIFDAANTADIETGELASERGTSKEVRDFGAMLARDHKMVRQQGRDLAKKLGVTPTPPNPDASAKAHADAMTMLRGKHGADFDHAFLQYEVGFHKSVIEAVQSTLLPAIQNAELKDFVMKVAPAFAAHMAAADNLDKKLSAKANR